MDTSKPFSDSADPAIGWRDDILPFVLLHQAKRDRALGLTRPGTSPDIGTRTMSLANYWRKQQAAALEEAGQHLDGLTQAAFLRAIADEAGQEIHRLIDGADTPEKRREIFPQVQRLNDIVLGAREAMEKLSG